MPLIEELPITQSHRTTHGWAYVPDTGPLPIAAVKPGNRKRGRDHTAAATAHATAKQQKAAQARLDGLDKENYKDGVSVPIPARQGEKKRDKKMTANVRRILTYQRAFAHYLADEEANATTGGTVQTLSSLPTKVDGRKKAASTTTANMPETPAPTAPPAPKRGRPPGSTKKAREKAQEREKDKTEMPPPPSSSIKQEDKDNDVAMSDAPKTTPPPIPAPVPSPSLPKPNYDPKLDANPLLRTTGLPKMPSDRVMAALLAEPPLSYTAARAKVVEGEAERPVRRFCAICGYWGKVKCRKCGEWTCGIMECWKGHEGVCVAQGMF